MKNTAPKLLLLIAFFAIFAQGFAKQTLAKHFEDLSHTKVIFDESLKDHKSLSMVLNSKNELVAHKGTDPKLEDGQKLCATVSFDDELGETGWDRLHLNVSGNCGPHLSMFAAGVVEGLVTAEKAYQYNHDMYVSNPESITAYQEIKPIFEQVYEDSKQKAQLNIQNNKNKDAWEGMSLFMAQFDGMVKGINLNLPKDKKISKGDLLLINSNGEKGELTEILPNLFGSHQQAGAAVFLQNRPKSKLFKREENLLVKLQQKYNTEDPHEIWKQKLLKTHCSVLFKMVQDSEGNIQDVYGAHGTWDDFGDMIKTIKTYNLNLKADGKFLTKDRSMKSIFPSYPSAITSQDDYYINDDNLLITETTLGILDDSLYTKKLSKETYIPTFLRIAASNLIGKTPEEWGQVMTTVNTGTYNSHWMVLDASKVEKSVGEKKLEPKTFYYVEQIPGSIKVQDATDALNKNSYWASYNIPFVKEHQNAAGYTKMYQQTKSDDYSFDNNIRAKLFGQLHEKVQSIDDMKFAIRFNSMPSEKLKEKYGDIKIESPSDSIAARYDIQSGDKILFGETDAKISSLSAIQNSCFFAIMSPTTEGKDLTPFKIPDDVYSNLVGVPQTYNYEWSKICA